MPTVNDLMHVAAQDLRIVSKADSIAKASDLLCTSRNRLIVMCGDDEKVAGVLSRADILRGMHHENCGRDTACEVLASKEVICCRKDEDLDDVWAKMSMHNLNAMPVIDGETKPKGVLSSKCVLVRLLSEARNQDQLMRDYINGMGYH